MKKNFFNLIALCAVMVFSFTSCDKDEREMPPVPETPVIPEKPEEPKEPEDPEVPVVISEYIYVLNSGNMGNNNATLSMYDLKETSVTKDIFEVRNGRRLGDTGQDIIVYGSKMYIAVFTESTIEVTDLEAKSIKQIKTEGQPRNFAVHEGYVYITYYNGYVARLDTASLTVDAKIQGYKWGVIPRN
jgi:hypothetical protein